MNIDSKIAEFIRNKMRPLSKSLFRMAFLMLVLSNIKVISSYAHPIEMSVGEIALKQVSCLKELRAQPHHEAIVIVWANNKFSNANKFFVKPLSRLGGKVAKQYGYAHIVSVVYDDDNEEFFEVHSERCGIITLVKQLSETEILELIKLKENAND